MIEQTSTSASSVERPVPPDVLRRRAGSPDLAAFQHVGNRLSTELVEALQPHLRLTANSRALDFGCGCGRVATYFCQASGVKLYGTDVDGEAIAWCRENLADVADFQKNAASPPLPFADEFFDFVYSISVFSHLPRRMETAWLAELSRVTKPGGYLILTTLGPHLLPAAPEPPASWFSLSGLRVSLDRLKARSCQRRLHDVGFFYFTGYRAGWIQKFYGTSYHTHEGIRAQWGQFFEIEAIVPKGINDHQDLVLCRRPG